MSQPLEVIGLGAMNLDYLCQVERFLQDGEARLLGLATVPGGSAANTVYALARLGVKTGFVGAVGSDPSGQVLIQDLASVGVDTTGITVKAGARTGFVLGLTSARGRRALYVSPEANALLRWEDLDLAYLGQAKVVRLSSFANDAQLELQKRLVAQLPASVALDFAPGPLYCRRGWRALAPILTRTSRLFVNQRELRDLIRRNLEDGTKHCLEGGCQTVVVTLGGDPRHSCYIASGSEAFFVPRPAFKFPLVDTTGAGDAFAAGFTFGCLRGKPLGECGRLGSLVAAFSLSGLGARAGLPTLAKLAQRYREEYGDPL